jgi:hypothetical protein
MILRKKQIRLQEQLDFIHRRAEGIPMADYLALILRIYPTVPNHCQWYLVVTQWAVIPAVQPGLPIASLSSLPDLDIEMTESRRVHTSQTTSGVPDVVLIGP